MRKGRRYLPSGALTLDLTPSGETEGTLSSIQMLAPGTTIPEPPEPTEEEPEPVVIIPAHVTLSLGYSMPEPVTPLDPTATVTATTEEDLAALLLPVAMVGSRMPFFCGSCVRAIERPYDPEKDAPAEVEDPSEKVRARSPSRSRRAGPVTEYFAVPSESGRELSFTLTLPEEVGEKRIADAAAAREAALATYEEEKAAAIEAHTAVAEAEASRRAHTRGSGGCRPAERAAAAKQYLGARDGADGEWPAARAKLFVPSDACSGPATLTITESTADLALFALPRFAELSLRSPSRWRERRSRKAGAGKGKKSREQGVMRFRAVLFAFSSKYGAHAYNLHIASSLYGTSHGFTPRTPHCFFRPPARGAATGAAPDAAASSRAPAAASTRQSSTACAALRVVPPLGWPPAARLHPSCLAPSRPR